MSRLTLGNLLVSVAIGVVVYFVAAMFLPFGDPLGVSRVGVETVPALVGLVVGAFYLWEVSSDNPRI